MKTLFTIIITFVLTAIIIIGGGAMYIAKENPYNIQACIISSFFSLGENSTSTNIKETSGFNHPLFSDKQEKMLEDLGVNVGTLPVNIPPEMEACAIEKLGKNRVEEIIGGDTPSFLEIFKAKDCL